MQSEKCSMWLDKDIFELIMSYTCEEIDMFKMSNKL